MYEIVFSGPPKNPVIEAKFIIKLPPGLEVEGCWIKDPPSALIRLRYCKLPDKMSLTFIFVTVVPLAMSRYSSYLTG